MQFLLPLFTIVALASAANETDNLGHAHRNPMTNANFDSAGVILTNTSSTIAPSNDNSTATPNPAEHDQLELDLNDEKKRFNQTFLDCDKELKKIIQEVTSAIKGHDHENGKKKLDDLRAYQPNLAKNPCQEGAKKSDDGKFSKNKKEEKPKNNGAQS
jgi:hypothetical protein